MNKILFSMCLFLILTNSALSHRQHTHQYIVREGYNLLKLQIGAIPAIESHISTTEGGGGGNWQTGLITAGAWNEDEADIVYGKTGAETSVSHFWEPDNGDSPDAVLKITILNREEFNVSAPNAYQKIKKYQDGYWNLNPNIEYCYTFEGHNARLYNTAGQSVTNFQYHSLVELYKTGKVYLNLAAGVYYLQKDNGQVYSIAGSNGMLLYLNSEAKNKIVWEILGHMCHLIGDMSVPAHVHLDAHGDPNWGNKQDSYENWFGNQFYNDPQYILSNYGGCVNPYVSSNPLHYLMFTMAQVTDHFGSNGPYSSTIDDNIGGNATTEETNFLNTIMPTLPRYQDGYDLMTFRNDNEFTEGIKTTIRNSTMPYAIRATAGLLYWFAVEAGIIPIQVPFETLPQALSHAKVGQTIRIAPVAYDLTASATIPNGIKLEVSPGATLKFKNNSRLTVNGTLDAIGTPSQRIIFDGMGQVQTDETDALIRINGMASDNHAYIKYADIKNANCLVYANHLYRLSIENCTFSQFSNTPFGYALNIIDYTSNTPTNVKNNIITGLWDYGYEDILPVGIKVSTWEQNPSWDLRRVTIEGNTITKCYKAIEIQHANVKIKNNTIRDSYKGIEFNHAQAEINSNILRENVYGVYLLSSQVGFIYNTIYNNSELGIWSQNSYSNFTRNRVSHNLMGTYFYSSASNFRENYIGDNGLWQVMSDHLSNSIFGGANIGETRGYNAIVGTSTSSDVITVSGGSYVELGAYDPGSEYNLRGYNSII